MAAQQNQRNQALYDAAGSGDDAQVVSLLAQRADINWKNEEYGWTPLHIAANNGHTSTCQLLIDNRADIDACDQYNQTPLHLAAYNGHTSTCQLLIDNRADCTIRTKDKHPYAKYRNKTALEYAEIGGKTEAAQVIRAATATSSSSSPSPAASASTAPARDTVVEQLRQELAALQSQMAQAQLTAQAERDAAAQAARAALEQANRERDAALLEQQTRLQRAAQAERDAAVRTALEQANQERIVQTAALQADIDQLRRQLADTAATSIMVVFVQQLGQAAPLRIEMPSQGATVGLLKALISLAIHQPSHHMQLVFNGQQLASDAQPIADTGITRESSVMLRIITPNDDTPAPQRAIDDRWLIPEQRVRIAATRLGGGALGEVFPASWLDCPTPVVVKRLYFMADDSAAVQAMGGTLSEEDRRHVMQLFMRECSLNSQLRHPNIVLFLGVVVDAAQQPRYLMLEMMSGGSLKSLIYPNGTSSAGVVMPLEQATSIIIDLCRALEYLHSRRPAVLHLDIKPDNILLDASGRAKLSDLGESHVVQSTRTRTGTIGILCVGAPDYRAPEMQFEHSVKDHKTDMFSLGVVVAEIGSGRQPNPGPAMRQTGPMVFQAIAEQDRRADDIAAIQHERLRKLARQLIRHEPADRLSAAQAAAALL